MKTSRLTFTVHPEAGDVSAIFERPDRPIGLATLAHGAGAGMEHPNIERIAQALVHRHMATFRYQFPFMERGGGRDRLEISMATVRQAAVTARRLLPDVPLIAGGHSFGGRITSMAAAETPIPDVRGLFFCAYPLHPPGKPSDQRAIHLPQISVPVLFISGTRDRMMTAERLQPTLLEMAGNARMEWLATCDHGYRTLKRERDPNDDPFEELGGFIADWFQKLG